MPSHLNLRRILFLIVLPILCCPSASSLAQNPANPAERIGGRVVDAKTGQPLPHALVTLTLIRSEHTVASTYTDGDGTYRFGAVPPGKYRLTGATNGHISSAYLGHQALSTAIVTGAGLPVDSLVLSLVPAASIAGRVVDENGDPVPHAQLSLFRQGGETGTTAIRPAGMQLVDDEGNFEFYPLTPGRYFLCARGNPWYAVHPLPDPPNARFMLGSAVDPALDVAYPTVFYPAASSSDAASPLDLAAGDEVTANLQFVPQHAITLTLHHSGDSQNPPVPQLMENVFGFDQPVFTQAGLIGEDQVLTGIPPGHYDLRQFSTSNRLPVSAGSLDLTSNTVRETTAPAQLASVTLTILASAADPLPKRAQVTLVTARQNGNGFSRPVNDKGIAELDDIPPGDYRLRIAGDRRPNLPVASLTVEGHPVPEQRLHIRDGRHLAATALLSGAPVTVEGFVRKGGTAVPGSMVVLVPAGADTEPELFRRDQSDLDGSFSLANVAPGKYLLIALDGAWSLPWTDLHALTPYLLHAQPVVVPEGGADTLRIPSPITSQAAH